MSTASSLTINRILTQGAERQVSDIHLSAGNQPVLRRNGKLETLEQEAVLTPELLQEMIQVLVPADKEAMLAKQKSVTVAYSLSNRARFRVHVDFQKNVPAIDLRYIPLVVPKPNQLGLGKALVELTGKREGLVLICGTIGSGRTTTLASLIDNINHTSSKHLVTLEDPIEYFIVNDKSLVKQRDLGDDTPSLQVALEDVKNEDVNIVAIDVPIPASDWTSILKLASSGALVLVVLEADSTVKELESLVTSTRPDLDKQGFRTLLAEALLGATCQRLLPRVGGGRVLVSELLLGTQPVKALMRDGKILQLQSILETSREEGMISLERNLADLVKTGEVVSEEAMVQAANPDSLKSMLKVR
ncbi:MAG: ATPase, T2SS/T4P/T4SS family [Patescibacteria group bacterium]